MSEPKKIGAWAIYGAKGKVPTVGDLITMRCCYRAWKPAFPNIKIVRVEIRPIKRRRT